MVEDSQQAFKLLVVEIIPALHDESPKSYWKQIRKPID